MEKQISHSGGWYKWPCQKSQGDVQPCAEVCAQELFKPSVGRGLTQDCGATTRAILFPSSPRQGPRPAASPSGPSFRASLLGRQTWGMSYLAGSVLVSELQAHVSSFSFSFHLGVYKSGLSPVCMESEQEISPSGFFWRCRCCLLLIPLGIPQGQAFL